MHVVHELWKLIAPCFDIIEKRIWQVLMHTAWTEVCCVQTGTTGAFVKDHQLFALLKAPKRRGECANVERLRGHVEQVVQHAADLAIQNTDQRCAARNFDTAELFNRETPSVFLIHRGHIIETVEIWQVLQVRAAFHQLFCTTVQQANMGVTTFNDLAVEL